MSNDQIQNCYIEPYNPYPDYIPKIPNYNPVSTSNYLIGNQKTDFEKLTEMLDSIRNDYHVSEQKMNWQNLIFIDVKLLTVCDTNFLFDTNGNLLGVTKDSYEQ